MKLTHIAQPLSVRRVVVFKIGHIIMNVDVVFSPLEHLFDREVSELRSCESFDFAP